MWVLSYPKEASTRNPDVFNNDRRQRGPQEIWKSIFGCVDTA